MRDVFVRDVRACTTTRVDLGSGGVQANGDSFGPIAMSADGRSSHSSPTRPTWRPAGLTGNDDSFAGAMSPGGRYVFTSRATNLVPGHTNGHVDVFVRDRRRGTTRRIDLGMHGRANGDALALGISAGGCYRLYASQATNIVSGDTNHAADLYLRDRQTGKTIRIDVTDAGAQANHGVGRFAEDLGFAMSPGARWVAFASPSTNLLTPTPGPPHLYLRGPLY